MSKNEYKKINEEIPQTKETVKETKHTGSKTGTIIKSLLDGTVLTRESVVKLLPFGLYVTFLIVLYIGNSYYSEKVIKKTNKVKNELKELEFEYITVKSDLMHVSKQSEVAHRLDSLKTGIKESLVPPIKLFIFSNSNKK